MKAVKIITGIVILLVLVLAYIAHRENQQALWWKTKPMRDKRHLKKETEPEPEPEPEEEEPKTETPPNETIS